MPPDCSREQGDWLRGAAERVQVLPGLVRSEKKKVMLNSKNAEYKQASEQLLSVTRKLNGLKLHLM